MSRAINYHLHSSYYLILIGIDNFFMAGLKKAAYVVKKFSHFVTNLLKLKDVAVRVFSLSITLAFYAIVAVPIIYIVSLIMVAILDLLPKDVMLLRDSKDYSRLKREQETLRKSLLKTDLFLAKAGHSKFIYKAFYYPFSRYRKVISVRLNYIDGALNSLNQPIKSKLVKIRTEDQVWQDRPSACEFLI